MSFKLLGEALVLALSGAFRFGPYAPRVPQGKAKPKQGTSNPLRGYYANHSHQLTEYASEKNRAKIANGKTGFKGFRKVRKFVPETGMTTWVTA